MFVPRYRPSSWLSLVRRGWRRLCRHLPVRRREYRGLPRRFAIPAARVHLYARAADEAW